MKNEPFNTEDLLDGIGGRPNIVFATSYTSHVRIVVADLDRVDMSKLEAITGGVLRSDATNEIVLNVSESEKVASALAPADKGTWK